jgi:hypothetical protein
MSKIDVKVKVKVKQEEIQYEQLAYGGSEVK